MQRSKANEQKALQDAEAYVIGNLLTHSHLSVVNTFVS